MKKIVFILLIILIVLSCMSNNLFAAQRGLKITSKGGEKLSIYNDYYALIIGVSEYDKWPDLPNAVKDAREVNEALKMMGFITSLLENPTAKELTKAFNILTFNTGREENRAILLFYAGHGETEILADGTKLGYIVPKDCPPLKADPMEFINLAMSMKDIEAYSLRIKSKHVLMLFDSCFSGSIFSLVRAMPENVSEKNALPVRQYITAGMEDETVPDKSIFKRSFLIGLEGDADLTGDGYITGSELGMYLSEKIINYSQRSQHPQYGKINNPELDRGDFIFMPLKRRQYQDRKNQKGMSALISKIDKLEREIDKEKLLDEQIQDQLKDEIEIRYLLLEHIDSINKRDKPRLLSTMHDEAKFMAGKNRKIYSKKEWVESALDFAKKYNLRITAKVPQNIKVEGDEAAVIIPYETTFPSGRVAKVPMIFSVIKKNNKWIIIKRNMIIPER